MKNEALLIRGELNRLVKYGILPVSFATSAIWIAVFLLISKKESLELAPLFILTDVAVMSVVLIGASHHLEKQEGTIRSMMMMPVSVGEILTAKVVSSMTLGIESTAVTAVALYLIHGIVLDYALLFLFVVVASAAHAAIGFWLSLISRDFTGMLGLLMTFMFVFVLPTVFFMFGMIDKKYEWLLMVSPPHAASVLITSAVLNDYDAAKTALGAAYLLLLAAVLFKTAVYPKFKDNAVRG